MLGLTLDHYQSEAARTAIYPGQHTVMGLTYATLGLTGEAGEMANKAKKLLRDRKLTGADRIPEDVRADLAAELGDVLWYASQLASELGVTLGQVADQNLKKLKRRAETGTLSGAGDHREDVAKASPDQVTS